MERIKIKFNKQENKIIKIGKDKIEVVPFISTQNFMAITDICMQQFDAEINAPKDFGLVKTTFDMLVTYFCTNINIEGIKTSSKKKDVSVSIDFDAKKIEDFDASGIIYIIKPYIKNYDDCYATLLKIFEMENIYNALNEFARNIPSAESLGEGLKATLESFKEYTKKDPDLMNRVIKESVAKPIQEQAKKEITESKKTKNK